MQSNHKHFLFLQRYAESMWVCLTTMTVQQI